MAPHRLSKTSRPFSLVEYGPNWLATTRTTRCVDWFIKRESTSPYSRRPSHSTVLSLSDDGTYKSIFPDVSVRNATISHGKNESGIYESSCFFVKHVPTGHEFIFFGDVEPDSIAQNPRNVIVWRAAAPQIPHDLSVIFIECSYPAGRPIDALYGHLSPEHLVQEMLNLATEVVLARSSSRAKKGRLRKKKKKDMTSPEVLHNALAGLRVYIMHCKETYTSDRPINHVISDQCRDLLKPHNLGVEILTADQGMQISESLR